MVIGARHETDRLTHSTCYARVLLCHGHTVRLKTKCEMLYTINHLLIHFLIHIPLASLSLQPHHICYSL